MAEAVLRTARLILRREAPGDRAAWAAHLNRPEVLAHLGGVRSEAEIDRSFAVMAEDGRLPYLFIERVGDGALLGKAGLSRIAEAPAPDAIKGEAQVGWSLRQDAWGHGYAREAAEAMLGHGFGALGLRRIWAQTSDSNARSTRLIERLGMTRHDELSYRDPGYPPADNPATVWSIGADEWAGRG